MKSFCLDGIMGLCVGDALGVPVEFCSRKELDNNPVNSMRGYGSHNQPPGTWSDDSSLTLCLAESLLNGIDYNDIAERFLLWLDKSYMTPYEETFDIGHSTLQSILKYKNKVSSPILCGGTSEYDNGNGSLMRILPLAFFFTKNKISEKFNIIKNVSSITHAHPRSVIACCIYVQTAVNLISGQNLDEAFEKAKDEVYYFFLNQDSNKEKYENEINMYKKILLDKKQYINKKRSFVFRSGYVVDTLDASMWCLFNSNNYSESVLKAVNLGDDTDTTGAVTGGLAGIIYGYNDIPYEWLKVIAKRNEIEKLCNILQKKLS